MTKRFARLLAAAALGLTAPLAASAAGSAPQATQTATGDSKVTIPVEAMVEAIGKVGFKAGTPVKG